jgi:hypothetical protein
VGDVGDVDAEAEEAVLQALDRDRVVEVAGALAVDGDDGPLAQVLAAGPVLRLRIGRIGAHRVEDGLRELLGDSIMAQHDLDVDARLDGIAEVFEHPAHGAAHALDAHHHVVGLGDLVSVGDGELQGELGIVGHQPAPAALGFERAHQRLVALGEDLCHRAFRELPVGRLGCAAHAPHQHRVAGERAAEIPPADEQLRLLAVAGAQQGVPGVHGIDDPHCVGRVLQGVPAPLDQGGAPAFTQGAQRRVQLAAADLRLQLAADLLFREPLPSRGVQDGESSFSRGAFRPGIHH